ncbi:hypothetical protein J4453_01075 [Candidatus Woesearchaeota archaeon]|nr:hypothetical protein [Candidatus Woesearchaeota archaeon]
MAVRRSFASFHSAKALLGLPGWSVPSLAARHDGAGEAGDAPFGLPSEDMRSMSDSRRQGGVLEKGHF